MLSGIQLKCAAGGIPDVTLNGANPLLSGPEEQGGWRTRTFTIMDAAKFYRGQAQKQQRAALCLAVVAFAVGCWFWGARLCFQKPICYSSIRSIEQISTLKASDMIQRRQLIRKMSSRYQDTTYSDDRKACQMFRHVRPGLPFDANFACQLFCSLTSIFQACHKQSSTVQDISPVSQFLGAFFWYASGAFSGHFRSLGNPPLAISSRLDSHEALPREFAPSTPSSHLTWRNGTSPAKKTLPKIAT